MGFLAEIFNDIETVSGSFYNKSGSMSNGQYTPGYSSSADLTVTGAFWRGSMADKFVSEKIRPDVSGVFVFNYEDYTTTIEKSAKLTIGSDDYSVIYLDNVAEQNEIIVVPVKEMT